MSYAEALGIINNYNEEFRMSYMLVSQPAVIVEIHDLREGFSPIFLVSIRSHSIYQFALCIVPLRRLVRVYLHALLDENH